jgi:hypothetical protein
MGVEDGLVGRKKTKEGRGGGFIFGVLQGRLEDSSTEDRFSKPSPAKLSAIAFRIFNAVPRTAICFS